MNKGISVLLLVEINLTLSKALQNQNLIKSINKTIELRIKITQASNSSFRYTDDVLSQNNSKIGDYLHLIYPTEFDVNDTTDTPKFASSILSTSLSTVAIFQHQQHMEFTFHISYVILEFVSTTVILWTELSY